MKTLLLVDGSSYLYRAYHALPDLRTSGGEPTGALRGFISMLHVLRQQVETEHLACVFDAKGKTFRDDLFSEYKANRTAMPDDLGRQIEPICAAVRALGWPIIQIEGIEADDVIATLARRASEQQFQTVVSTSDKDLAQLVNEHVTLVNTMSNEKLDIAGVERKFGVPPGRIVDYLTLVGDSVDNVPGVDKVGPKTAAKWLHEYGSLDGLVANAHAIKGAVGENLRKALPWLPTARKLVTIRDDCNLGQEFEVDRSRWPCNRKTPKGCASSTSGTSSKSGSARSTTRPLLTRLTAVLLTASHRPLKHGPMLNTKPFCRTSSWKRG